MDTGGGLDNRSMVLVVHRQKGVGEGASCVDDTLINSQEQVWEGNIFVFTLALMLNVSPVRLSLTRAPYNLPAVESEGVVLWSSVTST